MTIEVVALVVIAAFILGALEGHNFWAWLKSWFVKEATTVADKITGHTGPTGA